MADADAYLERCLYAEVVKARIEARGILAVYRAYRGLSEMTHSLQTSDFHAAGPGPQYVRRATAKRLYLVAEPVIF